MTFTVTKRWLCAAVGVCVITAAASAAFVYDESVDGALSNDGMQPTVLTPGPGNNYVFGSVDGLGIDQSDFFTFGVPAGWTLAHVCVYAYSMPDDDSFLGIEDANVYVTGQQNPNYFGYTFFGQEDIGVDILPELGASNGNFTPPLGAGDYAFWINEGTAEREYALTFTFVYPGDLNCDGVINFGDINPFVAALMNPEEYTTLYPECAIESGDVNGDGTVDFADINPFVALVTAE